MTDNAIPETRDAARVERVLKLLDREREIILNGPLSDLGALVARRETALAQILTARTPPAERFLALLRDRAERNRALLRASLEGVRTAIGQISRINAARDRLRTYSADGQSRDLRQTVVTRDKRA